jgi:hypothetical protein
VGEHLCTNSVVASYLANLVWWRAAICIPSYR